MRRFAPDGRPDRKLDVPAPPVTSLAFAGPDLDRLSVTTAAEHCDDPQSGSLFELEPGTRGLAPHAYAG